MHGKISILRYQQICDAPPERPKRESRCDYRRFLIQMRSLARGSTPVIDIDHAVAALSGREAMPPRAVVLTFDDAFTSFYDLALPVLAHYGLPAVLYVVSNWVGSVRPAGGLDLEDEREAMDAVQLREVARSGVIIGSQTKGHMPLKGLPERRQRVELLESRLTLEKMTGFPVRHLSYPFGSFDEQTVAAAGEAGYDSAVTTLPGVATRSDLPLVLPRKVISHADGPLKLTWKIRLANGSGHELKGWRKTYADMSPRSVEPAL